MDDETHQSMFGIDRSKTVNAKKIL